MEEVELPEAAKQRRLLMQQWIEVGVYLASRPFRRLSFSLLPSCEVLGVG